MVLVPRTGYAGVDFSSNTLLLGNPTTPNTGGQSAGGPFPYHGAQVYMEDCEQTLIYDALQRRWTCEDRTIYALQTSLNQQSLISSVPPYPPSYFALLMDDFIRLYGSSPYYSPSPAWTAAAATSTTGQAPYVTRGQPNGGLTLNNGKTTAGYTGANYSGSYWSLGGTDSLPLLTAGPTNTSGTVSSVTTVGNSVTGFTASVGPFGAGAGEGLMTINGVGNIAFYASSTTVTFQIPQVVGLGTGAGWTVNYPTALKYGHIFETKLAIQSGSQAVNAWSVGLTDTTVANLAANVPISLVTAGTTITMASGQNGGAFFYAGTASVATLMFQGMSGGTLFSQFGSSTPGATNQIFTTNGNGTTNIQQCLNWVGLRIGISTAGYVSFWTNFYDGTGWVLRGTSTTAVSTSASYVPYVQQYLATGGSSYGISVDYVWVRTF